MEKWEEYLELYLKHKKSLRLAPRTIDDARYHVTNLFKGKTREDHKPRHVSSEVILNYLDACEYL